MNLACIERCQVFSCVAVRTAAFPQKSICYRVFDRPHFEVTLTPTKSFYNFTIPYLIPNMF
jgi:hypothetical protein